MSYEELIDMYDIEQPHYDARDVHLLIPRNVTFYFGQYHVLRISRLSFVHFDSWYNTIT